ncbi:MAG: TonB-dependent receptor [Saprospiraceae bacterium]
MRATSRTAICSQSRWSPSSAWRLFVDAQVRHVQYQTSGVDNDLRSYDVQDDRVFFNPKAGVTWSLQQWCQLYASAAVAHREPSRSEYIDAPSGAFPDQSVWWMWSWAAVSHGQPGS